MANLTAPVARRKPGDPLVYLFASQADGWSRQGIAFKSLRDLERSGWTVGAWESDADGEFARLTRPD